MTEPHGFILLVPGSEPDDEQAKLYAGLRSAGFSPFDGNGRPLFVVLEAHAPKAQWFEAGFWAGARVPLFGYGKGTQFKRRHCETISRLGGWLINVNHWEDVLLAVARRRIFPSTWDADPPLPETV